MSWLDQARASFPTLAADAPQYSYAESQRDGRIDPNTRLWTSSLDFDEGRLLLRLQDCTEAAVQNRASAHGH